MPSAGHQRQIINQHQRHAHLHVPRVSDSLSSLLFISHIKLDTTPCAPALPAGRPSTCSAHAAGTEGASAAQNAPCTRAGSAAARGAAPAAAGEQLIGSFLELFWLPHGSFAAPADMATYLWKSGPTMERISAGTPWC
jgi:hypothetical protein